MEKKKIKKSNKFKFVLKTSEESFFYMFIHTILYYIIPNYIIPDCIILYQTTAYGTTPYYVQSTIPYQAISI